MFKRNALLISALAVLLTFAGACTNDSLDDGGGADVLIEVLAFENPAVTASFDQATMICTFTIEDWSALLANEPKNSLAAAPFNDIEMISATVSYQWDPGSGLTTPDRLIGLGSIAIPTSTSATIVFTPISFDDLSIGVAGRTANLTITFEGRTIEGTRIFKTVFRQLNIEACV